MPRKKKSPAQQYLDHVRDVCKLEKILETEYTELISRIDSIHSSMIKDASRIIEMGSQADRIIDGVAIDVSFPIPRKKQAGPCVSDPTCDIVTAYLDKAKEIAEAIRRANKVRIHADKYLGCLSAEQTAIIRAYYYQALSWPETAVKVGFAVRSVFRKHGEALARMNEVHGPAFREALREKTFL